jgi:transcription elongation factor SPT6
MLTEGDDVIRALDIPERLQLASVGLPSLPPTEMGPAPYITLDNLEDAADWMSTRISSRCTESFLLKDDNGERPAQYPHFLTAITSAIKFLSIDFLEVPFIWDHKKDYLFYSTYNDGVMTPSPFLGLGDLWTISHQLTKFRSLVHRKDLLKETFDGLEVEEDAYFEELFHAAETVEEVADLQAWVGMKYSGKLAEIKEAKAAEAEALEGPVRVKRATRDSVYDNAKKSVVSVLATVSPFYSCIM